MRLRIPMDRKEHSWFMPPRDMLVISDLSPIANNAVWRAAQLASEYQASVRVLHVTRDPGQLADASAQLSQLAQAVQQRLPVAVQAEVVRGDFSREVARATLGASILVVAARERSTVRERMAGKSTERLIRFSRVPVLVVRRPVARVRESALVAPLKGNLYQRVLVSVDLGADASGVIAAATYLSQDRKMQVFHAVHAAGSAGACSPSDPGVRPGTAVERTRNALDELIERSGAARHGAGSAVGFGRAADSVLAKERAIGAELIVLGKRQRGLFSEFFLGAVTQAVLSEARCDVLLVPTRPRSAVGFPAAPARCNAATPGAERPETVPVGADRDTSQD